jgi:hypothetical protein
MWTIRPIILGGVRIPAGEFVEPSRFPSREHMMRLATCDDPYLSDIEPPKKKAHKRASKLPDK